MQNLGYALHVNGFLLIKDTLKLAAAQNVGLRVTGRGLFMEHDGPLSGHSNQGTERGRKEYGGSIL